ncbi:hypothetical protein ACF1BU_01800 [Streptomyces sp. NPDC014724]|uniref:hypothetical protein n=1 Tax=unclassified Streptomyces TaxID=2593676 RepID=UPI0036F94BCF
MRARTRLDMAGALLVTAGTTLLVLGLVRTSTHSWGSASTLGTLGAAVLLLAAFAAVELRVATRSRQVGGSLGLAVLVTVAAQVTGDGGRPADLAAGYAAAFWVCAGLLALAALVALVLLSPPERTASVAAPVAAPEDSQKNSVGAVDPGVSRSTQG